MKRMFSWILILVISALLSGCGEKEEPIGKEFLYYLNMEESSLKKQNFNWSGGTADEMIQKVLDEMKEPENSQDCKAPIPEQVVVERYEFSDGKLNLYFNEEYGKMPKTREILCRGAVVQSLGQIPDVFWISFYVDGQPLLASDKTEIGYMRGEDFLQTTGESLHTYQGAEILLYYPNMNGDRLLTEKRKIRYDSNMSIEKVIVEQIIEGSDHSDRKAAVPKETKLLGISVKDQICYVNFNEGFLVPHYGVDPMVSITALVNSIIDGGEAVQVQISVNGETNVKYQGVVDLSKPMRKNDEYTGEIK